jgi:fucose permease
VEEAGVGGLLAALKLALIPMMLISGILVDQLGIRSMVLLGSLLTGMGIFSLALSTTKSACFYSILLIGLGAAGVNTGSIKLMPLAFFENNPAASLNMGHVFIGLGALIIPAFMELLITNLGFRRALGILAVVSLIPALAAALTSFDKVPHEKLGDLWGVLGNPAVWLAGLVFILYGPLEAFFGAWGTSYLTELGHTERRTALLLSGFWLTFMAGRLVMSFLQQKVLADNSEAWVILVLALLAAVVIGNLAGTHSTFNAGWGFLLVGAVLGPIFPTLVGLLFNQVGTQERGTAYGAMFAIGSTGSALLAPLIGGYARKSSVRSALRIPTLMALLLAGGVVVLALTMVI